MKTPKYDIWLYLVVVVCFAIVGTFSNWGYFFRIQNVNSIKVDFFWCVPIQRQKILSFWNCLEINKAILPALSISSITLPYPYYSTDSTSKITDSTSKINQTKQFCRVAIMKWLLDGIGLQITTNLNFWKFSEIRNFWKFQTSE